MVFKRKGGNGVSPDARPSEPPSIVSADLRVVGDLVGDGEVHVEGRVDGNIRAKSLTVGKRGHVEGKVNVAELCVFGTIRGSIKARKVRLMRSARVIGDVAHEKLEIEAGAVVDGFYKRADGTTKENREPRFREARVPPRPPRKPLRRAESAATPPAEAGGGTRKGERKAVH